MAQRVSILDRDLQKALNGFKAIEKHFAAKERKAILRLGATPLIQSVRAKIPEADEPVYRYSTPKLKKGKRAPRGHGNVVAVYMPGNLRRSYKVLPLRRTSDIYVGPQVAKKATSGVFAGSRTDGYYMHLIEFGTRHFGAIAPIRRGLSESVGAIRSKVNDGFKKHMRKFEAKLVAS